MYGFQQGELLCRYLGPSLSDESINKTYFSGLLAGLGRESVNESTRTEKN